MTTRYYGSMSRSSLNRAKKISIILFVAIIVSGSLISCDGQVIATATETPTLTSSPSSTATLSATPSSTSCPTQVNQFSPDNLVSLSPVLIVVLFDDEQTPFDALELMSNVMQLAAEPGDGLALFRSGYRWHQFDISKVVIHESPRLEVPHIVLSPTSINTLTPRATLTPLSTPTPPSAPDVRDVTIFNGAETLTAFPKQVTQTAEVYETQVMATEVDSRLTSTAFFATATEIAGLNTCANSLWNQDYADIDAEWQKKKADHKAQFLTQIAATLMPSEGSTQTPTPYTQTEVYDGLVSASLVFSNLCDEGRFSRCILIIIDDLHDWRSTKPLEFDIRLDNVDVISILPNCSAIFSPSPLCGPAQENWTPQFLSFGANSIQYHNNIDVENYLVDQISKDR